MLFRSYLAHAQLGRNPFLSWVFRLTDTLTLSPERPLVAFRLCIDRLGQGTPICVFSEGGISRQGTILSFQRGAMLLAKRAKVPIVPVHLDGVWGSVFSWAGGRFFNKFPRSFPYRVTVRTGSPIDARWCTPETVRQAVLALGRISFEERLSDLEEIRRALLRQMLADPFPAAGFSAPPLSFEDFLRGKGEAEDAFGPKLGCWADGARRAWDGMSLKSMKPYRNWMRLRKIGRAHV